MLRQRGDAEVGPAEPRELAHVAEPQGALRSLSRTDSANGFSVGEEAGLIRTEEGQLDLAEPRFAPACCTNRMLRPFLSLWIGCGGQPPELTKRQWQVVSAVTVAGFFSHFDDDLLPLCLRQLQRDLDIPEAQVCLMLSVIGSGKAGAAVTSVLADVLGRRYVFFASVLIFSILSVVSAFQKSVWGFVILQLIARIFLAGKDSMANVYLVEETDPKTRGWVMGTYSSVAVTGGGCAVILFGLVGGKEDGWRYLYGLAAGQVFFLLPLWRMLPEKTKGQQHSEQADRAELREQALKKYSCWRRFRVAVRSGIRPLRLLVTAYPKRAVACLFVNMNNGFAYTPSAVLKIKQLQDVHGLGPGAVSVVVISSGLVALMIFPTMGRISDKGGRRLLLCCFMGICPVGVLAFYNAPGNLYLPFYFIQMMAGFALNSLQTTFFAETFPASYRCTANGVMMLFSVIGGVVGLASESLLYSHFGTHAAAVSVVLLPAFISPFVVHCCLPETAGKDLDQIAPEIEEEKAESDSGDEEAAKGKRAGPSSSPKPKHTSPVRTTPAPIRKGKDGEMHDL